MNKSKHYMGTLFYDDDEDRLRDIDNCSKAVLEILSDSDVEIIGKISHKFDNGGFSIVIALAESHLSIHTWPERGCLQLDVFLCNYLNDNTERANVIFNSICSFFNPSRIDVTTQLRL